MKSKVLIILSVILVLSNSCNAGENNDLRTLFLNNKARICGINIRNFNASDKNGNGIIEPNEDGGNFLNAIDRLDELKLYGVNTLHILPITPVGKLKALGTAGSLYAASDFFSINPQLVDNTSDLSPVAQAAKFIAECHKRGIRVIIDLPSCGSYDLFLKHPELFIKDDKNVSIVPTDWTDVRLLNTGTNDNLNPDVFEVHKKFVDMVYEIGGDGIRADVATIKPYKFWEELIRYAREKDSEFMFLAEASDSWREPPSEYAEFTPYNELLKSGFDGYYGSFFNLKDWNANEFIEHIKFNQKLLSSYKDKKSVILSFTTHDEVSPILIHGENFSVMIAWLESVLQYNPYFIDGFVSGDDYLYPWANNKAEYSQTDDDTYFVHRGKLDIFNFSKRPGGNNANVIQNAKSAYKFRIDNEDLITKGDFVSYKTGDDKVFAFSRNFNNERIIVIGNLDFKNAKEFVTIKVPKLKNKSEFDIIKGEGIKAKRNKIKTKLEAGEIKIIKLRK